MKDIRLWSIVNGDSLDCLDNIADFLHQGFSQKGADRIWSKEYFDWKLGDQNPAGKGYLSYATSDDKIVGVATLTRKKALYNGKELIVAEIGDTYTLPDIIRKGKPLVLSDFDSNPKSYVNKSVFGRIVSEITNRASLDGVSIIYGTPNKNSFPGYIKRLGFLNHTQYNNITNYRPSSQLLIKKHSLLKPLSKFFYVAESIEFKLQKMLYSFWYGKGIKVSIRMPKPDEIDALWEETKPKTGFSLVRDGQYWFYRFVNHPLANYKFINFRKNGSLIAMVVVREFAYREGRRVASIVEWMLKDNISIGYLLSETLNLVNSREVDYYYFYSSAASSISTTAKGNLFLHKNPTPIIFAKNDLSEEICKNNNSFEFHLGSSDAA
jgi:hypothetical protein